MMIICGLLYLRSCHFLCLLGTSRGVWVGILISLGFLQRDPHVAGCRRFGFDGSSFGFLRICASLEGVGVSPESRRNFPEPTFLSFGGAMVSGQPWISVFFLLFPAFFSFLGSAHFCWVVGVFFFSLSGLSSNSYAALPCLSVMYASVRVEGKFLEVTRGDGGLFPFKVADASRRKSSFIRLSF